MAHRFEITAECNFLRAARDLEMRASTFWKAMIAPFLNNANSSPYVARILKQRAIWEIKDLIPRGVEMSMFKAFLNDPTSKAHTVRELRTEYGVSREYVAIRLLGYLERHLAEGKPSPFPKSTYLANLIPGRISDDSIIRMVAEGEYPHTLAGFARDRSNLDVQKTSMQHARDVERRKARAAAPKRWDEPITQYLARLESQRAHQFDGHVAYLRTNPADLKAFARYLRDTLPPTCSKKMPNPIAVMQYINQRLRSRIEPAVYDALHTQATAFAMGQPHANQDRLISLK